MRRRRGDHADKFAISIKSGRIPLVSLIQTLAVAEHLSFHRAPNALGFSQSSVSARIKALEENLGILLFERNTRGVRLTEAGRLFVEKVSDGVEHLDNAVKSAGMAALGEGGRLRMGVHGLISHSLLANLIGRYRGTYPGVWDNLTILREEVASESVDLIYLDPPFNSNANYNVLFRPPSDEAASAQAEAFRDTWTWGNEAQWAIDEIMMNGGPVVVVSTVSMLLSSTVTVPSATIGLISNAERSESMRFSGPQQPGRQKTAPLFGSLRLSQRRELSKRGLYGSPLHPKPLVQALAGSTDQSPCSAYHYDCARAP